MSVERDDRYRDDDRNDDRRFEQGDRRDRTDTHFEWRGGIYVRIR